MLKVQISNLLMCFTDLFSIILHKSMYFRADTALGLSIESKPYEEKKKELVSSTISAFQNGCYCNFEQARLPAKKILNNGTSTPLYKTKCRKTTWASENNQGEFSDM